MKSRLELHEMLCDILGSRNVYYRPPESVKMKYPAIVYSLADIENHFANNAVYNQMNAYELTVIDKDPENEIIPKLSVLPLCRFNRHYESDNLNHDVFTLYY